MGKMLFVLFGLWTVCQTLFAQEVVITVNNPSDFIRQAEMIEVNLSDILQYKGIKSFNSCRVTTDSGKVLVSQIFTTGMPDTKTLLLFQSDFPPKGSKQFRISISADTLVASSPVPRVRVDAQAGLFWGNNIVAYQMTGLQEHKNILPVIIPLLKNGKGDSLLIASSRQKSLDSVGSWSDILFSWPALGAGSGGLFINDSIHTTVMYNGYKILAHGPLRCSFEIYRTIILKNTTAIQETMRVSLDTDCLFNSVVVKFSPDSIVTSKKFLFAAGLTKTASAIRFTDKEGSWMSVWHPYVSIQGTGAIGMSLYVPLKFNPVPIENNDNYLLTGRIVFPGLFKYYCGAAIAGNEIITDEASWREKFIDFVQRKKEPLRVLLEN